MYFTQSSFSRTRKPAAGQIEHSLLLLPCVLEHRRKAEAFKKGVASALLPWSSSSVKSSSGSSRYNSRRMWNSRCSLGGPFWPSRKSETAWDGKHLAKRMAGSEDSCSLEMGF